MSAQSVALLDTTDAVFTGSGAEVTTPIAFGPGKDQVLVVARTQASDTEPRPVVIFIHGGSWAHGHAPEYAFVARNMAARGYVGVSAGYRLVPGGEYPAMLEDGAAAMRWVVDNIAGFGGDPSRIYLMGHSAGAYNAVMLALDKRWLTDAGVPDGAIKGVIGLAGPYDFLPLDSEGTINAFGGTADLDQTQPINFAHGNGPPLLLLSGTEDTTVRPRNSKALAKAMTEAGQPTEAVLLEGTTHLSILLALSRPFEGKGQVKAAIFDFLARQEAKSSGDIQPPER
ncbi:alpha/beta hydrolase [Parerythrobacter aestuarii]|uniref:alpha/beta hydrolase n=1 Tax=Parerythrobacter aestuarii TaxID=3020909 RepID=UPI0024DEC8B2|nr:alpha/beta hydrolase [Parerythrobacter aestuarii]